MSIEPGTFDRFPSGGARIVYLTMRCAFAAPPLAALIAAGVEITAIVLPGLPGGPPWRREPGPARALLPMAPAGPATIDALAHAAGIPLVSVSTLDDPAVTVSLRDLRPDLLVSVCFPRKIPEPVIATAPCGGVNLHPSLLPRWRGPDPLFWTFQAGDRVTGVTVHELTTEFDGGPVLEQQRVEIELGCRLDEMENRLATIGGEILANTVKANVGGRATARPQAGEATWAPLPSGADWLIESDWDAERAFRFARGVAGTGSAPRVRTGGGVVEVRDAVTLEQDGRVVFDRDWTVCDETIEVRFADGIVRFATG